MAQHDRRGLHVLVTLYAALALGWVAVAWWIVPSLLVRERPGPTLAALKWYIQNVPAPFLTQDILGCWREFSCAVLIALALHLSIALVLRRAEGRSSTADRPVRLGHWLHLIMALAFLAVTVLTGPRHDYYLFLQIWAEVRLGHDPWFMSFGMNGMAPLNAYGPLFNLFAPLAWVNPLAPKLLFAYGYVLFATLQIRRFTASHPGGVRTWIVLTALFWNPFPWVEIAVRGHFDILVGLSCLGAVLAWERGQDIRAGIWLAAGVLLKYLPVVLVPFLALDRGRLRTRFLATALASIAMGMLLSCHVWGLSTLSPLTLAATRSSAALSIFRYIRSGYSPVAWAGIANYDFLSPILTVLALLRAWWWSWSRHPDIEAVAAVAVTTTVLFHQTGYPQYHMMPFVVGSSWAVRHWDRIRGRAFPILAISGYFAWLAGYDVYYSFVFEGRDYLYWFTVEQLVGLPTFLLGWAFLAGVVSSEGSGRKSLAPA